MPQPKSMTLSEVISMLQSIQQYAGDLPVYLSKDEEGNAFGTIDANGSFGVDKDSKNKCVVLYPWKTFLDLP